MEYVLDFESPYLTPDSSIVYKINSVREEITAAINNAILNRCYDCDVCLSFGTIHINPYGSISKFSFNGVDVLENDQFIIETALRTKLIKFHDIRGIINNSPDLFNFFPILSDGKIQFTVLKTSKFFVDMFGESIIFDHSRFCVKYTPKYMIIYVCDDHDKWQTYCFICGPFTEKAKFEREMKALRQYYDKELFFSFINERPEIYNSCGRNKSELLIPKAAVNVYNFYKSTIVKAIIYKNRVTGANNEVKVKKTKADCLKLIVEMKYGSISEFCRHHNIKYQSLYMYFSGNGNDIRYQNDDCLSVSRLEELLNLPFKINEHTLTKAYLMEPVKYEDIPDAEEFDQIHYS